MFSYISEINYGVFFKFSAFCIVSYIFPSFQFFFVGVSYDNISSMLHDI